MSRQLHFFQELVDSYLDMVLSGIFFKISNDQSLRERTQFGQFSELALMCDVRIGTNREAYAFSIFAPFQVIDAGFVLLGLALTQFRFMRPFAARIAGQYRLSSVVSIRFVRLTSIDEECSKTVSWAVSIATKCI